MADRREPSATAAELPPIQVFGTHEESTIAQLRDVASRAERAALMADGHVGYVMPIGGVAAYDEKVSVVGAGFDIACGNAAIRTNLTAEQVGNAVRWRQIADEIERTISFGVGRKNRADDAPVDHPLFSSDAWYAVPAKERGRLKTKARQQLGTVGSGNHYVDVLAGDDGTVWVAVHFGSRGLGHTIASAFLALSQNREWGERAPEAEVLLPLDAPIGHDYWQLMTLAGEYAYAGREWVARKVVEMLGGHEEEIVHNHHNYCVPGHAQVPTPNGPKRMADVRAGDTVYAFDATEGLVETRVQAQWHSGQKRVYTISTRNRRLAVSGEHPVLVVQTAKRPHPGRPWHSRTAGSLAWKTAETVRPGDVIVCAERYYRSDVGVGLERARLLGAFLGDGWRRHEPGRNGSYTVGLAIGAEDQPHTSRYLETLARTMPAVRWRNNAPGEYGITGQSVAAWRSAADLGAAEYSPARSVPSWAFALPDDEKREVLAGYFDSDGSVGREGTTNHGRGFIASASRDLVVGLRELAISLGKQVTPVRHDSRVTNFGTAEVFLCQLSADSMADLDLWHADKAARRRETLYRRGQHLRDEKVGYLRLPAGTFAQRVLAVDVSQLPEDVYDLSVAHPSHSFVCEGVVVHNCWREEHAGRELVVVRKGATPAFPGQRGFVGGSMGDDAVIVRGAVTEDSDVADLQRAALYSTVHGAGRIMSRTQAAGKRNRRTGEVKSAGRITPEMMNDWIGQRGVILRGGGLDESPHVYRRLPEVLAAQEGTIAVEHVLRPLVVVMAGANEFDPYKD